VDLSVNDIMTKRPICLPPIVTVGEVYDVLRKRRHHCFPVAAVDSKGNPTGVLIGSVARKVSSPCIAGFTMCCDSYCGVLMCFVLLQVLCTLILHKAFGFSGEASIT
jgi:hypothetical protein